MTNMTNRLLALALVAFAAATGACGGDGSSAAGPDEAGGSPQFENPTGAAFQLPPGITLKGKILGGEGGDDGNGGDGYQPGARLGVSPTYVEVCFTIHNSNAEDDTLRLPAGLIFISKNIETQNGTQVREEVVVVPGGRDTTVIWELHCLNAHRDPSTEEDEFTIGPVSDHPGLREVIALVAGKLIDQPAASLIGGAIWEVSDFGGLTDETRDALRALPPASAGAAAARARPALRRQRPDKPTG